MSKEPRSVIVSLLSVVKTLGQGVMALQGNVECLKLTCSTTEPLIPYPAVDAPIMYLGRLTYRRREENLN